MQRSFVQTCVYGRLGATRPFVGSPARSDCGMRTERAVCFVPEVRTSLCFVAATGPKPRAGGAGARVDGGRGGGGDFHHETIRSGAPNATRRRPTATLRRSGVGIAEAGI